MKIVLGALAAHLMAFLIVAGMVKLIKPEAEIPGYLGGLLF